MILCAVDVHEMNNQLCWLFKNETLIFTFFPNKNINYNWAMKKLKLLLFGLEEDITQVLYLLMVIKLKQVKNFFIGISIDCKRKNNDC